jgi:hypothetical protein
VRYSDPAGEPSTEEGGTVAAQGVRRVRRAAEIVSVPDDPDLSDETFYA